MTISAILNVKGSDVIAIGAHQTVSEAVKVMQRRQIGALVVTDEKDGSFGIFTERDVIGTLAEFGAHALDDPINKHMTKLPVTVVPETTVNEVMTIMTDKRIRHLPVTHEGALCGIISIGDVVNYRIERTESEAQAMRDYIAG